MWVWYSLLGVLVLLIVVFAVPIYGHIAYDGAFSVRMRVMGVPITLVPQAEKKKKAVSRRVKKDAAKSAPKQKESKFKELVSLIKQDDVAGTLHFLREVARLAAKTAGRLLRAITVKRLNLQLLIASDDASTTAQRYGKACGVLYPAMAAIENTMRVRERDLCIEPNFLLEKSVVRFDIRLRLSVWRLLGAGISLLWGFLMLNEKSDPQITKEVS